VCEFRLDLLFACSRGSNSPPQLHGVYLSTSAFRPKLRLLEYVDRLILVRRPGTSSRHGAQCKSQCLDLSEPAPLRQPQKVFGQIWIAGEVGDVYDEYEAVTRNPLSSAACNSGIFLFVFNMAVFLSEAHFTRRAFSCALSAVRPGSKLCCLAVRYAT
jgi:hypothetical protein